MYRQSSRIAETSSGLTVPFKMEQGLVRAACFDASSSTLQRCTQAANSQSSVKLSNFKTGGKRERGPVDIIIQKNYPRGYQRSSHNWLTKHA